MEKFIGDAVMAVWGAPVAHEDDAERAVRAALELLEAVPTLGGRIQARAGVLTGEAAVTLGAINQGMVAGDLVNTASRLQSVAPPGSVLVGEATQRATSGAIAYEEAGEQTLKGKQAPVAAWRALRVVAERGGRNRAEGLEAPFVGRVGRDAPAEGPLPRHRTRAAGEARVGDGAGGHRQEPPRMGVPEVHRWPRRDRLLAPTAARPAYGEGITFWALGEMVRAAAGWSRATTRKRRAPRSGER